MGKVVTDVVAERVTLAVGAPLAETEGWADTLADAIGEASLDAVALGDALGEAENVNGNGDSDGDGECVTLVLDVPVTARDRLAAALTDADGEADRDSDAVGLALDDAESVNDNAGSDGDRLVDAVTTAVTLLEVETDELVDGV